LPGRVKTRLLSTLGEEGAAALHIAMARDVSEVCKRGEVALRWSIDGDLSHPWVSTLEGPVGIQARGDLGDRLVSALGAKGVALGCDSPTLPTALLRQATACEAPVILGPSFDGGCWCIGWNQPCPEIFENIPWSTSQVMAELVLRVRALGLECEILPYWYDVDEPSDVDFLRTHLGILPEHCGRHSRHFFQSIKGGACPS
jgi:glycosyltransferase A (GT-A) superfamily protein (DUF2064 family)